MLNGIPNQLKSSSIVVLLISVALLVFEYTGVTYPPYELTTAALCVLLIYVSYIHSPGSLLFLSTLVLSYPLFVPFITRYVYGVTHYTILGVQFESRALANKVTFLGLVMVLLSVYTVRTLYRQNLLDDLENKIDHFDRTIPYSRSGVVALVGLTLAGAYLLAPGPTILSVGYEEQASYMPSWATFAGAVYKGSWAVLFSLLATSPLRSRRFQILVGVTVSGTLWLALHGRRVGSIGMVVLLFGVVLWHHFNLRVRDLFVNIRGLALGLAFGLYVSILVAIGRLRKVLADTGMLISSKSEKNSKIAESGSTTGSQTGNSGSSSGSGGDESVVSEAVSSLQYGQDFVGLPGGAHGVYGTLQATVYLFDNKYSYLWGETFIEYLPQAIPAGIWSLIDMSPPASFRQLLASNYNYNGGNYILNPYYANFGVIGPVLAGLALGLLLSVLYIYLRKSEPDSTLMTVVATALFVNLFRAYWYTQLNWIDTLQGVLVALILYGAVYLVQRPDKIHTTITKLGK